MKKSIVLLFYLKILILDKILLFLVLKKVEYEAFFVHEHEAFD